MNIALLASDGKIKSRSAKLSSMSFSVETVPPFEREVKRLIRRYPFLKKELLVLAESLELNLIHGNGTG